MQAGTGKIRVMLVDDSAVVRGLIQAALHDEAEIEVVATAMHGGIAVDMLKHTPVDIIVLDIEMPVMDGLTALPLLLAAAPHAKVIMASTLTLRNAEISLRALQLGASDYIAKPTANDRQSLPEFYHQLIEKIKALGAQHLLKPTPVQPKPFQPLAKPAPTIKTDTPLIEALKSVPQAQAVAIASSTGGPQALLAIFTALKDKIRNVPIFITQHMPPSFTTILATHLRTACGADCHEAREGEKVQKGVVYIAPGNYHMTVVSVGGVPTLQLNQNPPENFCRPAADPMLFSLARIYGKKLMVVVLTGMGSDGAKGCAEVVAHEGLVVAQNEATCVVYGMPKAVVDAHLARIVLPLNDMAPCIARAMGV